MLFLKARRANKFVGILERLLMRDVKSPTNPHRMVWRDGWGIKPFSHKQHMLPFAHMNERIANCKINPAFLLCTWVTCPLLGEFWATWCKLMLAFISVCPAQCTIHIPPGFSSSKQSGKLAEEAESDLAESGVLEAPIRVGISTLSTAGANALNCCCRCWALYAAYEVSSISSRGAEMNCQVCH